MIERELGIEVSVQRRAIFVDLLAQGNASDLSLARLRVQVICDLDWSQAQQLFSTQLRQVGGRYRVQSNLILDFLNDGLPNIHACQALEELGPKRFQTRSCGSKP